MFLVVCGVLWGFWLFGFLVVVVVWFLFLFWGFVCLLVGWVFFIGFTLIWNAWRREQKSHAKRQANHRALFRKCTSFSKTVVKSHWGKAGSGEPEGALPAPLGSGKGHRSAPQPHGALHPPGAAGDPSLKGLEPQWRMVRHWTFQRLLHLGRQQLQPGLFWPADLCLCAGQAVTHHFCRTLTFFA